jgi:hypothetical protein
MKAIHAFLSTAEQRQVRIGELGTTLAAASNRSTHLESEISINLRHTTWCDSQEDATLPCYRLENLKPRKRTSIQNHELQYFDRNCSGNQASD